MKVREVMTREVRVARPAMTLARVGTMMLEEGCGVIPVADDDGEVQGVITDRDVCIALTLRDARPSQVLARDVMTQGVAVCRADEEVQAALRAMRHEKVRRLPVVDSQNRLEGILSLDDIVTHGRVRAGDAFAAELQGEIVATLHALNEHAVPALVDG